jgi:hypothetical protein
MVDFCAQMTNKINDPMHKIDRITGDQLESGRWLDLDGHLREMLFDMFWRTVNTGIWEQGREDCKVVTNE